MLESEVPHFFPKMHLKVTFLINPYRLYFTVGIVNSRLPASGKHCQTHFIVLTVSLSSWQIRLVPVYLKQLVPAEVSTKGTPYHATVGPHHHHKTMMTPRTEHRLPKERMGEGEKIVSVHLIQLFSLTLYPITPAAQQIYIAGKMEEEINDAKKFWG